MSWTPLASQISEALLKFLQSGEMAVLEKKETVNTREYSEIEKQILQISIQMKKFVQQLLRTVEMSFFMVLRMAL